MEFSYNQKGTDSNINQLLYASDGNNNANDDDNGDFQ